MVFSPWLFIVGAIVLACQQNDSPVQRDEQKNYNIILLAPDSMRADALYSEPIFAPLIADSIVFPNANI